MIALFDRTVARLRDAAFSPDKPEETPETTARALWLAAAGRPCAVSHAADPLPALSPDHERTLGVLIERRVSGEPLAYLTGRQGFMGLELITQPGSLIPRRETELLGTAALDLARRLADETGTVRILDLCCGAGNLAVALAVHEPRARVYACDISVDALQTATKNVDLHSVGSRVELRQGDLFAPVRDSALRPFDLVVANPPYIPSHKAHNMPAAVGGHEPIAAFDGGDFGFSILFRLAKETPEYLRPGGWLGFEVGVGQARIMEKRMQGQREFEETKTIQDAEGTARVVLARRSR